MDPQSPVNVSVTDKLLTKTFNQLLANLMNAEERTSDSTLATIMMLAAFDIFFLVIKGGSGGHMCMEQDG